MNASVSNKRVWWLSAVLVLVIVLGIAFGRTLLDAVEPTSPAMKAAIANEAVKIAATNGRVERKRQKLLFHVDGGKTITLKNEEACGDKDGQPDPDQCVSYRFVNAYPDQDGLLVHVTRFGGSLYTWINGKSGQTYDLCEQPRFSQGGDRFILVGAARETESCPNDIEVWGVSGPEMKREFAFQYPDATLCCQLKEWRDEDHALLSGGAYEGQAVIDAQVIVEREDGAWHVKRSTDGGNTFVLLP